MNYLLNLEQARGKTPWQTVVRLDILRKLGFYQKKKKNYFLIFFLFKLMKLGEDGGRFLNVFLAVLCLSQHSL